MIGQNNLQQKLLNQINNNKFPRFSILVGPKGSGKKTISKWICNSLHCICVELPDCKIDTIRNMIRDSYKVYEPTAYIIADADNMSIQAKNALLKITEEPPNNAYFILTLESLENTLATIKSRGTSFNVDIYSAQEIGDYYLQNYDADLNDIILDLCETPGEVDLLKSFGVHDFYDYVCKVIDNIAEVSGSNSFKIADKISLKADDGKYDLRLFWKAFMKCCMERIRTEDKLRYLSGVQITSKYLQELRITGINKQSTFDMWLLDIRKEWM